MTRTVPPPVPQGMRILDYACDHAAERTQEPLGMWRLLEKEVAVSAWWAVAGPPSCIGLGPQRPQRPGYTTPTGNLALHPHTRRPHPLCRAT